MDIRCPVGRFSFLNFVIVFSQRESLQMKNPGILAEIGDEAENEANCVGLSGLGFFSAALSLGFSLGSARLIKLS